EKLRLRMLVVEPASLQQATALGSYISWTVQFERDDKPFSLISIAITGGMPSHGHGLPTQPRVTAQLGDGRYRVEGIKFTMPGRWQLVFNVGSPLGDDRVVLEFDVRH
ncbi:MAG: FixH family protein, partial [Pseudomonadales bacterium]